MTKIKIAIELAAVICVAAFASSQTVPGVHQTAEKSICANIVALSGAKVDCAALTPKQQEMLKSIPILLKKILDRQPDLAGLKSEMDQMYALVQASSTAGSGVFISLDDNSNDNDISRNKAINGPLKVTVDRSQRNDLKDNESVSVPMVPCAVDSPHQMTRYANTSNDSLRTSVINFANELREYARVVDQEDESLRDQARVKFQSMDFTNLPEEQKRRLSLEARQKQEKRDSDLSTQISEKFLGQATEYREELRWRLGRASLLTLEPMLQMSRTFWPYPGDSPKLNVYSLEAAAKYLEDLARRLP